MRILLVKEGCPICKVLQEAVNRFNVGVGYEDRVNLEFIERNDTKIQSILDGVVSKDEERRGLATPILVFDDFVLRREKIWHGISDPIEVEAILKGLHEEGYNLKEKYDGIYF